jgi:hypothetical protein
VKNGYCQIKSERKYSATASHRVRKHGTQPH